MSRTTLRTGLVGLSKAEARHLLPTLAGRGGRHAQLVAVTDADTDRAEAHVAMLGTRSGRLAAFEAGHTVPTDFDPDAVSIYGDADEMVEADDLDAVVIASGDRLATLAERALHAGRHVLVLADAVLADEEALESLIDTALATERVFWPAHAIVPERSLLHGPIVGARATWNLVRSSEPAPSEAVQLLPLTAPLAALVDYGAVQRSAVAITGRGPDRTVRVSWRIADSVEVEIEFRLGWTLGRQDRAWITLHDFEGVTVDVPLAVPGTATEPLPSTLRGVLWHTEQGALPLRPPHSPADAYGTLVTRWVDACQAIRPETGPVGTALVAARLASDLAIALRRGD